MFLAPTEPSDPLVKRREFSTVVYRQTKKVGVGHLLRSFNSRNFMAGQRDLIGPKDMMLQRRQGFQCLERVVRAGCVAGLEIGADCGRIRVALPACGEPFHLAEPSGGLPVMGVILPNQRQQDIHVQEVGHGNSASSCFAISSVIFGLPLGVTNKGRPFGPITSLACRARGAIFCSTIVPERVSIKKSSPGRNCSLSRIGAGMTI